MKVVIDTNVLLVSISDRSPYHLIFKSFIERKFSLCVSTEILDEYAEIFSRYSSDYLAKYTLDTIENAPNIDFITRYFAFELIKIEPDDNKFTDCAIASNADFIMSQDKHFNILKTTPFPKVQMIDLDAFMEIQKTLN